MAPGRCGCGMSREASDVADALKTHGFVVLPSPFSTSEIARVQAAYDDAFAHASPDDVHVGRTSTRVNDFVNRGPEFDLLYTWPPVLDAARRVVGGPFRLSVLHARTLHPGGPAQELHVDIRRVAHARRDPDGGRLPAGQRRDALRAGLAPLDGDSRAGARRLRRSTSG